jgi:hypothetical protein
MATTTLAHSKARHHGTRTVKPTHPAAVLVGTRRRRKERAA